MSAQPLINEMDEFLIERKEINLKQRLAEIITSSKEVVMNNEESFRKMTALYAESKSWEKQIEFARKNANSPDQDRINTRNDKAKELLTPLKQIQMITKQKCEQYQMMLEERKLKEQENIEQAVALLGLEETPHISPLDKTLRGDGAIVYTRTVRKFRIVDLSKVPLKYLQICDEIVELDIKLGIAEIAGIEIYEEKITQIKSR